MPPMSQHQALRKILNCSYHLLLSRYQHLRPNVINSISPLQINWKSAATDSISSDQSIQKSKNEDDKQQEMVDNAKSESVKISESIDCKSTEKPFEGNVENNNKNNEGICQPFILVEEKVKTENEFEIEKLNEDLQKNFVELTSSELISENIAEPASSQGKQPIIEREKPDVSRVIRQPEESASEKDDKVHQDRTQQPAKQIENDPFGRIEEKTNKAYDNLNEKYLHLSQEGVDNKISENKGIITDAVKEQLGKLKNIASEKVDKIRQDRTQQPVKQLENDSFARIEEKTNKAFDNLNEKYLHLNQEGAHNNISENKGIITDGVMKQLGKLKNIQKQKISKLLENQKPPTKKKGQFKKSSWNQEVNEFIAEAISYNQINSLTDISDLMNKCNLDENVFATNFLEVCAQLETLKIGRLYFNDLYDSKGGNLSLGIIGKFFRLCHKCKDECNKKDKDLILELYTTISNKYGVFDCNTCENIILGLSLTDKWKKIDDVINICKMTAAPTTKMYSQYIISAIEHKDYITAWDVINEAAKYSRKLKVDVYRAFLEQKDINVLNDLLSFFQKNTLKIPWDLADDLLKTYAELMEDDRRAGRTSVTPGGMCRKCHKPLQKVELTEEEFSTLKETFLNPVLVGKDIFQKTKPEELEKYFEFLEKTGKVDVVLDGLNIAYSQNYTDPHTGSKMLRDVVEYFAKNDKKIITLGRKHMFHWPIQNISYIKRHSKIFLAENISQDDPYLLYAAMNSGLGTVFVSRDQMRGHKFLLKDPEIKYIFSKWQQMHQFYLLRVTNDGHVFFKYPLPYLFEVQRSASGGWHLPIEDDTPGIEPSQQPAVTTWLCLK